jgi:ParB-like chromosome segregation protein Spo0J
VILEERAEDDYVIHQLVENLQRRQLGDMEQAEGLAMIRRRLAHRDPRLSEAELDERVARLVGLSARTVARYLALRELPAEVRDLIQDEELSVSQAQHLRILANPLKQVELAKAAVEYDLSAAAVRDAATEMSRRRSLTVLEAMSMGGRVAPLPAEEEEEAEEFILPEIESAAPVQTPVSEPARPRLIRSLGVFDDELDRLVRSIRERSLDRALRRDTSRLEATIGQVRVLLDLLEAKRPDVKADAA